VNDRARALRRRMTEAEKLMWSKLRGRRFDGVKFKRQKPIAGYIVDFVALDLKLIDLAFIAENDIKCRRCASSLTD